jgi:hypothetical protein
MSVPTGQVVPLFAIPFGVVPVADGDALNPALVTLFRTHAAAAGPTALERRTPTMVQSRDDLFDWSEPPVRQVLAGMLACVNSVVASINEITVQQFSSLRVESRAWYTLIHPDGCVPTTQYANTAWLAVYCAAAPSPSPSRFDSGVLRLHEARLGTMFPDATNTDTVMPYRPGHSSWRPVPGHMAVFPAWVTHEVALVRAVGDLVLVSARVRYVGPEQTGVRWW